MGETKDNTPSPFCTPQRQGAQPLPFLAPQPGRAGVSPSSRGSELPSDTLSAASQALGSAFLSGDLLFELRAQLGDDFSECTLLSKAFRQSYVERNVNKIDDFEARASNQLVADEDNQCLNNNGGCHPDVKCTPDPSRDPPVICGACPAGFDVATEPSRVRVAKTWTSARILRSSTAGCCRWSRAPTPLAAALAALAPRDTPATARRVMTSTSAPRITADVTD